MEVTRRTMVHDVLHEALLLVNSLQPERHFYWPTDIRLVWGGANSTEDALPLSRWSVDWDGSLGFNVLIRDTARVRTTELPFFESA